MTIRTPISLARDATVDNNANSAIHTDIDGMFVKYGITDTTHRTYNLPNKGIDIAKLAKPADLLQLAKQIENGAAEQRRLPKNTPPAPALSNPTTAFFALVAPWLAAELAVGAWQPAAPLGGSKTSALDTLYQLLYCPTFQLQPDNGSVANVPIDVWNIVSQAVKNRSGNFNDLLGPCAQLCSAIADEFNSQRWPEVW